MLRQSIATASVDLVYLDPPFNSQTTYNLLFRSPTGMDSQAQIEAFEDTWHWAVEAEAAFDEVMQSGNTHAADLLRAMRSFLGDNDMMAYITMMAVRLIELHRVLKSNGSLYLHCDPTASHYLKLVLDATFGAENFQNEIIWKRTGAHGSAKRWGPIHDIILYYAKGRSPIWNRVLQDYDPDYVAKEYKHSDTIGVYRRVTLTGAGTRKGDSGLPWRGTNPTAVGRHWAVPTPLLTKRFPEQDVAAMTTQERLDLLDGAGLIHWPKIANGVPQLKRYLAETEGGVIQDIILDINPLNKPDRERLGYPTQKPLALLERIIAASSNVNSVILDPFCGCGTTIHAAEKLGRSWVGIDVTHLAISLIERRLKDAFPTILFEVHGTPNDIEGARDLARRDKYQFQWWAVSLIEAQPYGGKKKGADSGIDGLIYFRSDAKTTERAIVSVKGGENVGVPMIRDLKGVLEREKAPIGVFLTLASPTRPMEKEAASAGFYTLGGRQYPRLQIITIEQALQGAKPAIPLIDTGAAFKRAAREDGGTQSKLDF